MSDGEIIEVVVADLGPGPMVRGASALDLDHIARMLPFVDDLPLIHVRMVAGGYEILDGHHRHAVNEQLKRKTMRAVLLELDDLEAFAYAAKVNGQHGAGLDLKARRQNATYLLKRSDWSDREIARCAVLSPSTVAKLRAALAPTARNGQLTDKRTSADGSQRPADAAAALAQREAIAVLLVETELDGNAIAKKLGCSVTTVRSVRLDLEHLAVAAEENAVSDEEPPPSSDEPQQDPAPAAAQDPGKAGAPESRAAATGSTGASSPGAGDGGGDRRRTAHAPADAPSLPTDWRDRIAKTASILRCPVDLLAASMTDDDAIDLAAVFAHVGDALDIRESNQADAVLAEPQEQNA